MANTRFIQFAAIAFGLLALYAAGRAIPNALWFPRNIHHDALRFGFIAVAIATGLALILPHRSVSALRRLAVRIEPGAVRFMIALALLICLLVAKLSGALPLWVTLPVASLFTIAFILPGLAFRGLPEAETAGTDRAPTMRELGSLIGTELRAGPRILRYLLLLYCWVTLLGAFGLFLGIQIVPTPLWAWLTAWGAILAGGLGSLFLVLPAFRLTPKAARQRTYPTIVLMACVLMTLSIFSCWIVLHNLLPATAAYLWGEDITRQATVIESDPHRRRRGCRGSVRLETPAGPRQICNLPQAFLEALSPGDTVLINGPATRLGQSIRSLTRID